MGHEKVLTRLEIDDQARRLLEAGHEVRVLVRDPARVAGRSWGEAVDVREGDLEKPSSLEGAFQGVHPLPDTGQSGCGGSRGRLGRLTDKSHAVILHLARKQEMRIVAEYGEADAWLKLSPADASSHFGEVFAQRVALFDYALKQGRSWLAPGR